MSRLDDGLHGGQTPFASGDAGSNSHTTGRNSFHSNDPSAAILTSLTDLNLPPDDAPGPLGDQSWPNVSFPGAALPAEDALSLRAASQSLGIPFSDNSTILASSRPAHFATGAFGMASGDRFGLYDAWNGATSGFSGDIFPNGLPVSGSYEATDSSYGRIRYSYGRDALDAAVAGPSTHGLPLSSLGLPGLAQRAPGPFAPFASPHHRQPASSFSAQDLLFARSGSASHRLPVDTQQAQFASRSVHGLGDDSERSGHPNAPAERSGYEPTESPRRSGGEDSQGGEQGETNDCDRARGQGTQPPAAPARRDGHVSAAASPLKHTSGGSTQPAKPKRLRTGRGWTSVDPQLVARARAVFSTLCQELSPLAEQMGVTLPSLLHNLMGSNAASSRGWNLFQQFFGLSSDWLPRRAYDKEFAGKSCREAYDYCRDQLSPDEFDDLMQLFAVTFPNGSDMATEDDRQENFEEHRRNLEDQLVSGAALYGFDAYLIMAYCNLDDGSPKLGAIITTERGDGYERRVRLSKAGFLSHFKAHIFNQLSEMELNEIWDDAPRPARADLRVGAPVSYPSLACAPTDADENTMRCFIYWTLKAIFSAVHPLLLSTYDSNMMPWKGIYQDLARNGLVLEGWDPAVPLPHLAGSRPDRGIRGLVKNELKILYDQCRQRPCPLRISFAELNDEETQKKYSIPARPNHPGRNYSLAYAPVILTNPVDAGGTGNEWHGKRLALYSNGNSSNVSRKVIQRFLKKARKQARLARSTSRNQPRSSDTGADQETGENDASQDSQDESANQAEADEDELFSTAEDEDEYAVSYKDVEPAASHNVRSKRQARSSTTAATAGPPPRRSTRRTGQLSGSLASKESPKDQRREHHSLLQQDSSHAEGRQHHARRTKSRSRARTAGAKSAAPAETPLRRSARPTSHRGRAASEDSPEDLLREQDLLLQQDADLKKKIQYRHKHKGHRRWPRPAGMKTIAELRQDRASIRTKLASIRSALADTDLEAEAPTPSVSEPRTKKRRHPAEEPAPVKRAKLTRLQGDEAQLVDREVPFISGTLRLPAGLSGPELKSIGQAFLCYSTLIAAVHTKDIAAILGVRDKWPKRTPIPPVLNELITAVEKNEVGCS